jgi:hypothetical protein
MNAVLEKHEILEKHKEKSFRRFLSVPDPTAQFAAATVDAPHFRLRLVREGTPGMPSEHDLWPVVYLSHNNEKIRRANFDVDEAMRFGLYAEWYRSNPNTIMVLERIPPDRSGISIVGSTIILPLRQAEFSLIESGALPVVKLGNRICGPGEPFDVLLFDTWVLHDDYQDIERRYFSKKHYGYGNLLALRHLALFWTTKKKTLWLYAEPDNPHMIDLLQRICFERKSTTAIGEPLLEMQYPPQGNVTAANILDRMRLEQLAAKVDECASWPLT